MERRLFNFFKAVMAVICGLAGTMAKCYNESGNRTEGGHCYEEKN